MEKGTEKLKNYWFGNFIEVVDKCREAERRTVCDVDSCQLVKQRLV